MPNPKIELQNALDKIRDEGKQKKLSDGAILRNMIAYLMEYRKHNTLSVKELETLVNDNKQLTERMLGRLKKIQSLSGSLE